MLEGKVDKNLESSALGGSLGSKIETEICSSDGIIDENKDRKFEESAPRESRG